MRSLLEKAISVMLEAHAGQTDKADAPYILHPLRVMLQMEIPEEMMAAVLHDVVEDSNLTIEDLRKEGFPQQVIVAVEHLTKKDEEPYDAFIQRVKEHPLAIKVKIADLQDNMDLSRIKKPSNMDRQRMKKYQEALAELEGCRNMTSKAS